MYDIPVTVQKGRDESSERMRTGHHPCRFLTQTRWWQQPKQSSQNVKGYEVRLCRTTSIVPSVHSLRVLSRILGLKPFSALKKNYSKMHVRQTLMVCAHA